VCVGVIRNPSILIQIGIEVFKVLSDKDAGFALVMLRLIEWLPSRGKAGSIPAASTRLLFNIKESLTLILHNHNPWIIPTAPQYHHSSVVYRLKHAALFSPLT
jgi:hypothetical protein